LIPSSIGKNVKVDLSIISDAGSLLKSLITAFKEKNKNFLNSNKQKTSNWWKQIEKWREKRSLNFINSDTVIKPQHAVKRLYELTKNKDTFITTEVGQHQMWAAQHYKFNNLID
jgi:acetolactate synthase-1/2/3 large subunit